MLSLFIVHTCLICNLKTAPVVVLHTEAKVSQNGTVRFDWLASLDRLDLHILVPDMESSKHARDEH